MECNNHSYIMKEGERYCDKCGVVAEDNIDYSSGANPLTQTDSEGAKYKRVADKKLGSGNTLFVKNSKITTASNGKAIQTYGKIMGRRDNDSPLFRRINHIKISIAHELITKNYLMMKDEPTNQEIIIKRTISVFGDEKIGNNIRAYIAFAAALLSENPNAQRLAPERRNWLEIIDGKEVQHYVNPSSFVAFALRIGFTKEKLHKMLVGNIRYSGKLSSKYTKYI